MASIVRREPEREPLSLREAMDRLFEGSFIQPGWFSGAEGAGNIIPIDVFETDDSVVVKATVPGVRPEDIEVTITGDLLAIKSEMRQESKQEKRNYLRQERRYGSACRQISLPAGVNPDKAEASFEHGVLTLRIPKVEAIKARTVKIVAK